MYKVLIADDERMIKKSLRALIENDLDDFVVAAEAKNGMEAQELIGQHKPDILITDIRMPVLDGLELLSWMDAQAIHAECIIISGYNEFQYAQQALRFGVTEYLLKPLDSNYFLNTMNKLKLRLQSRASKSSWRKQWLLDCKMYAERAAKAIWHLNDVEINSELERIKNDILSSEDHESHDIAARYNDYFIFLEGELQLFGESHYSFTRLPDEVTGLNQQDKIKFYSSLQRQIEGICEHIRQSRNWQRYHLILKDAQGLMETRFSDSQFNLDQAAAHYGISPNYFSHLLKKTTGMSFKQYLTHLRIQRAKELLNQPFIKIYEVGYLIGMEDYTHFSKTFKKIVGCSPSEFRNNP